MIRVYPEQLVAQLHEGLRACYLLCGNEPLLLQESQDHIRHVAAQHDFSEHFSFTLDAHTEWDNIFSLCQALSLFASRQTLLLSFPDSGLTAPMNEQLVKLSSLLHPDILLILRANKLTKAQENSAWFKALSKNGVFVSCQTPELAQLPRWVGTRAKSLNLEIDDAAIQLLCYCYEGNLLALSQALERLSLLYPDGKLTLPKVEQAVNDAAHFTPYHWLDALLAGKSKRAWHILQQLQQEDSEPVILLRTLQRELLQLLTLKRQLEQVPLRTLFDQFRVWQNRRPLMTQALQRLSMQQLQQAIHLLAQIEVRLKQDYGQSIWPELETLSMLMCGKTLPESFFDAQ
ncbi:DNA polymerase III subunit delta [Yersinia frederiksenii]|uniref:DNA polymerase III subunit delta n=2 Tax=Yersinia frederiksenii TaxID=29484 RepID=A0A380Q013_YERFR|nr:DNA polymerase III subunit delta [Yersinia frederiksenii]ATM96734.1 DNA polymerase III subunit delta [Yersinia frederiksenii]KGA46290.1 DNA polymerase III, delta subunit [Yersinia frederiksenii ATCC 33641]MDN0120378.1 DNA polymerase III subunit delta [Yersinia frederiksenii]CFR13003.1 DNA polymerase III subunit delta [Yersinia frederiksenii]CNC01031.1 DNA polymerase III subunit delta [Yersinia frederiksenii]